MAIGTIVGYIVAGAVVASSTASAISAAKSNKVNRANVQDTNEQNYLMFQEQNSWNREQWNLENEYNKPSEQLKRYLEAGINPLFTMSNAGPSEAAHLESADAPNMQAPQMVPVDFSQIGRSLLDGVTELGQLDLNAKDTSTRALAQQSQADVNKADVELKQQETRKVQSEADWNEQSFDTRLQEEGQKLRNLEAQKRELESRADLNEEDKKRLSQVTDNLKVEKDFIRARITQVEESVKQAWENVKSNRINANANAKAAQATVDRLTLDNKRFEAQVTQWNNENLLNYMYKFGKSTRHNNQAGMKAGVKGGLPGLSGSFEGSYSGLDEERQVLPATQEDMINTGIKVVTCGTELVKRSKENPTPQNLEDASKAVSYMRNYLNYLGSSSMSFDQYSPVPQSPSYDSIVFPNVDQMDAFAGW